MNDRPIPATATWEDIEEANRRRMHPADLIAERTNGDSRILNDEEIAYYNKFGPKAEWLKSAPRNDTTPPNVGNTRLCHQLPEWESFPVDILPGVCGDYVRQSAEAIDCDPSMVALPMLGTCAAAIGNSRRILPKKGYTEPAVLWLATIAESGSRKSPANDAPLKPIRKKEGEAIKCFNLAMSEYATMLKEHKSDFDKWLKSKREGDQPQEPEKPICRRFTVADTTTEALASRLSDNPRGLFLAVDELSGFFNRMNQYRAGGKGGDEAAFLAMHGAREWISDRKTGDKPSLYVPKAFLCIAGTVQPGILRTLLTSEHFESGMVARFLMAYPPARVNRWTEEEVSEETEAGYANMVDRLLSLSMPLNAITSEPEPICLPLTAGAKKLFIPFHNDHATEQVGLEGDLSAAWSKLTGYALRLALVVEHIAWAGGNEWQQPERVTEASMEAGITLAKWFANETRRIYGILGMSALENDDRKLAEKIAALGPVSVRDLMRAYARLFPEADRADKTLIRLVEAGFGHWDYPGNDGKNGRPFGRKYIPRSNDTTLGNAGTAGLCHQEGTDFAYGANANHKEARR